jgi:hypothetical protein
MPKLRLVDRLCPMAVEGESTLSTTLDSFAESAVLKYDQRFRLAISANFEVKTNISFDREEPGSRLRIKRGDETAVSLRWSPSTVTSRLE